ncbi:hypothetical protein ABC365_00315 [Brevundimonas sp. 3P9-tot-E]|jgi:uncharacterized membrane protein|uniref:hypothetical protein n=1 Tax=Brevundimonas TaxID=41275 RepID=UPI0019076BC2|nr:MULTISPECIES: hypothetical protein [Brevundimonas]MDA0743090.1 hypothetical protein [Pseudomonadota bacterium]MBK1969179.1 hypothetical protein [Brevundimonas diminuta]MBK1974482.1 hypothetical protein [Brevundimonas diminuta]MDA1320676.1 hypothetical protein [Pseudomonadota bacterium]MDM8353197.1 hypothetical protein [Brevundimonas diminuta]
MAALLAPFDQIQEILGLAAVVVTGLFAVFMGRREVRVAGVLHLIDGFSLTLVGALTHGATSFISADVKAILIWFAYALMTLRWPGRWLVVLTALQGLAVLIRWSFWLDAELPRATTSLILNLTGWMMLFILLGATVAYPRRPWFSAKPA